MFLASGLLHMKEWPFETSWNMYFIVQQFLWDIGYISDARSLVAPVASSYPVLWMMDAVKSTGFLSADY